MRFQKGNKMAVGNRGGKSWQERLKKALEQKEIELTEEIMKKLAYRVATKKLLLIDEQEVPSTDDVSRIAMPIVTKGMTSNQNVTGQVTVLSLPTSLIEKNNINASNEPNASTRSDSTE